MAKVKNNKGLCDLIHTGLSFTSHVKFVSGFEYWEVQLPLIISPGRYRDRISVIIGLLSGTSGRIVNFIDIRDCCNFRRGFYSK